MSSSKPHLSFTFESKDYKKRSKDTLSPLTFCMGDNKNEQQPHFIKLAFFYLDYLMKIDEQDKFRIVNDKDESYSQVIKHPMDFYKIREKLNKNQYKDLDSFKSDVDLIWQNCIQFNGTMSQIGLYSMRLRSNFNELWSVHNSLSGYEINDALRSLELRDEARKNMDSIDIDSFKFPNHPAIRIIQEKPKRVKERTNVQSIRRNVEVNERLNENLTADEKQKLAREIDNLIPALLGDVIDILKDSLHLDLSKNHIIPFSEIDTPILRRIEAYVSEAKEKKESVKRMYQNETMPSEKQLEILKRESKKFEELLSSKKFTGGSETSSDNDTAESSDLDNSSSSGDSDS